MYQKSEWERCIIPLTPMPTVIGHKEPWPFFHFWCHQFWPKLVSSTCILNCRTRKRSFQWCLDQSDWPNGAWDMHKHAQKVKWKTQSKISCHYTWLLHGRNCPSERFFNCKQAQQKVNHCSKKKQKERQKKIQKSKSLNTKGSFLSKILISAHAQPENHQTVQKTQFQQKAPGASGLKYRLISNFFI